MPCSSSWSSDQPNGDVSFCTPPGARQPPRPAGIHSHGPPLVSFTGFCVRNGKLTEPAGNFAHPFWDAVRDNVAKKANEIRRQGFVGAAMLPMAEREYTGIVDRLKVLDKEVPDKTAAAALIFAPALLSLPAVAAAQEPRQQETSQKPAMLVRGLDGGTYEPHGPRLIEKVQTALKTKRIYQGEVTGTLDEATMQAFAEFQKQNQLTQSGVPSRTTRKVLFAE